MGRILFLLSLFLLLEHARAAASGKDQGSRRVRWYVNAGDGDENVEFVDAHRDSITGIYPCCNVFAVQVGRKKTSLLWSQNFSAQRSSLVVDGAPSCIVFVMCFCFVMTCC